jgi:hypothetical protein
MLYVAARQLAGRERGILAVSASLPPHKKHTPQILRNSLISKPIPLTAKNAT